MEDKLSLIEEEIKQKVKQLKKKNQVLKDVEVSVEECNKGIVHSKIKASTSLKVIKTEGQNECAETSVNKAFKNLNKLMDKDRSKKKRKMKVRSYV